MSQHDPFASRKLIVSPETLARTFIQPENQEAKRTLVKYMEQILFGLHDFLKVHVGITEEKSLKQLSLLYSDTSLPRLPEKRLAEVITDLIQDIAPHAVNVASPYFIGHMTAAIPFFMVHLKTITTALNQNVVKLETSKVLSIIEKQVLAKIHRLIYGLGEGFYQEHVQNAETALGCFTEDGTIANLTALWVARNRVLGARGGFAGVEAEGMAAAYRVHDIDRAVVLVSRLGHYSLEKAGGVLGIGNRNVIAVPTDQHYRIDLKVLEEMVTRFLAQGRTKIIAMVGIAGATETGTIDPLPEMAALCRRYGIHFHVDAAWGGPTLMSERYSQLLEGIELADSVTIDGHKQFYMPMTCGMIFFKDPKALDQVAYHARYINRPGSVDLGIKSLSGSREANSLVLDSALKIMGTSGYGLLLEHGIDLAQEFARAIRQRPWFELTSPPSLNILTYRLLPPQLHEAWEAAGAVSARMQVEEQINELNRDLQRRQREAGRSFVSRTTLTGTEHWLGERVVLRVVLMNPMTTPQILDDILDEQEALCREIVAELLT